jgi:NADH-quinone oxidoreductase subunit C
MPMTRLDQLLEALRAALGERLLSAAAALNEVTVVLRAADHLEGHRILRDDAALRFEQCVDLAGMDYQGYGDGHAPAVGQAQPARARAYVLPR